MKRLMLLFAIMSCLLFSCSRQHVASPASATLAGNWRMMVVKDNGSGLMTTKPANIQGNVDLVFTVITDTSGVFYGHTPTNEISQSDYLTGANQQLTIPFLDMTKVGETSWGQEFVDNIRSAQQYSFESSNKLIIKTTDKLLTFQRQ